MTIEERSNIAAQRGGGGAGGGAGTLKTRAEKRPYSFGIHRAHFRPFWGIMVEKRIKNY